jgi:hypothetical protein
MIISLSLRSLWTFPKMLKKFAQLLFVLFPFVGMAHGGQR